MQDKLIMRLPKLALLVLRKAVPELASEESCNAIALAMLRQTAAVPKDPIKESLLNTIYQRNMVDQRILLMHC